MTATIEHTADGFVRRSEGPGVKSRVAGSKWFIGGAVLLLILGTIAYAQRADNDYASLSIKNYDPNGARALAEVAQDQGLHARQIAMLGDARIIDPAHTTLVIAEGESLQPFQARTIAEYPGDLVVIGPNPELWAALGVEISLAGSSGGIIPAQCDQPDAQAAESISSSGVVFTGTAGIDGQACFLGAGGDEAAIVFTDGPAGGHVTLVADPTVFLNATISDSGNAALALRVIGKHENAVWYLGSYFDTSILTWTSPENPTGPAQRDDVPASTDFLPPGTGNVVFALGLALFVVALWRARRFGPLVHEPLPVVIRSSESTRGRARLYRAAGASGRAGASLRASAAARIGARIGVARSADRSVFVAAAARACGRSVNDVEAILYGPPPTTESAMMSLIEQIDTLEREVHRT